MKNLVVVLFFFCSISSSFSNSFKRIQAKAKLVNKDFVIQLPIEITNHKYILPNVRIRGSKKVYRFLLDTGCQSSCISKEIFAELGLTSCFSDSITDGVSKKAVDFSFVDISFNNLNFEKVGVSVHSKSSLNLGGDCIDIDGIIGYNLMRSCIWSFDKENVFVTDRIENLKGLGKRQSEKISKGSVPLIVGNFVDGFGATMLFDLGDNGTFEVETSSLKYLRTKKVIKGKGSLCTTIIGDVQDTSAMKLIKVPGFRFETDTLKNCISYVGAGGGHFTSIGAGILDYFKMTFDFPKRNLYVKSICNDFNQSQYDDFGFKYKIDKNKVVVRFVWNKTEAQHYQIRPGQQILRINSLDLNNISRYDECELKSQIEKELLGDKIQIKIEGINQDIVLEKENLFKEI